MSPSRPNGTWSAAEVSRKVVATQPSRTASIPNSRPMGGRAMLTEDDMKGIRNAVMETAASTMPGRAAALSCPCEAGFIVWILSPIFLAQITRAGLKAR
jgi:hypothetical protein